MPIKINLLAEAQAAEEMRRRDPVKRALWLGGFVIALALLGYGYTWAQGYHVRAELANLEAEYKREEPEEKRIKADLALADGIQEKINLLEELSANRFLWGSVLNALQEIRVEDIQVTKVSTDQRYEIEVPPPPTPGTKADPNRKKKPAVSTEVITMDLTMRDFSDDSQAFQRYKAEIEKHPYFIELFKAPPGGQRGEVTHLGVQPPQEQDPASGRTFRSYTLTVRFPRIARQKMP